MTASLCVHHWTIDPPNGPTSDGVCRKCKAVRTFRNDAADTMQWPAPTQANGRAQSKKGRLAAKLNTQPRELYVEGRHWGVNT